MCAKGQYCDVAQKSSTRHLLCKPENYIKDHVNIQTPILNVRIFKGKRHWSEDLGISHLSLKHIQWIFKENCLALHKIYNVGLNEN